MPRQGRIDAPGALHHIIIRGIERKALFRDQTDRDRFVERLGTVVADTECPGCLFYFKRLRPKCFSIGTKSLSL